MKIEKINENKIKFLLTNEDLKEREIKLSELAQGTEKAQAFFRDIMTEALEDFGFDATNSPLMIEAMPIAIDGIIIIVSKVTSEVTEETTMSLTPKSLDSRKFKQKGVKIIKNNNFSKKENSEDNMSIYIYSFDTLDDVMKLSLRIENLLNMSSKLYKYNDRYFICIKEPFSVENSLDFLLSEYGQKHLSTAMSNCYLQEHAEVIIAKNALNILSSI